MTESGESDESEDRDAPPLTVPWQALSPDALRGVIESFVLREGTDYGEREVAWERKCADVRLRLERGEATIVFDPGTSSVSIVETRASASGGLDHPRTP
jgi:uncharacterized protein YheU (UPF0270 family)